MARAGRFGTKGLAITFVSDAVDAETLNKVQDRFDVTITELPDEIDVGTYSKDFIVIFCSRNISIIFLKGKNFAYTDSKIRLIA